MTVGHYAAQLRAMGVTDFPAGPGKRLGGCPGAKPLEPPKNLRPAVPKTGSQIDQNHVNGYVFYVHCSTESQEQLIPKDPKF